MTIPLWVGCIMTIDQSIALGKTGHEQNIRTDSSMASTDVCPTIHTST